LGKASHAFANFDGNSVVVFERGQLVVCKDGWQDVWDWDTHVLKPGHGCAKIKIFDLNMHELGLGRGEHTVEQDFGHGDVSGGGTNLAGALN
jgi:hypothetical protein